MFPEADQQKGKNRKNPLPFFNKLQVDLSYERTTTQVEVSGEKEKGGEEETFR